MATEPRPGPPPLAPFGLVLHHSGSFTHEGHPIANRKLRERLDRAVRFLPVETASDLRHDAAHERAHLVGAVGDRLLHERSHFVFREPLG